MHLYHFTERRRSFVLYHKNGLWISKPVLTHQPICPLPLKLTAAIGTVAKALGLPCPQRKDTLFEMRQELSDAEAGKSFPSERIEKINQILMSFIRDEETTDAMMAYVTYGYENENGNAST